MTTEQFREGFAESNRKRGTRMDDYAAQEITNLENRLREVLNARANDLLESYPVEGYPV